MSRSFCPMCGVLMRANSRLPNPSPYRVSRDHILPRARGGTAALPEGVRNERIICQSCNSDIQACCHCVGLLACVRAVAADSKTTKVVIMKRWRIGAVRAELGLRECRTRKAAQRREWQMDAEAKGVALALADTGDEP